MAGVDVGNTINVFVCGITNLGTKQFGLHTYEAIELRVLYEGRSLRWRMGENCAKRAGLRVGDYYHVRMVRVKTPGGMAWFQPKATRIGENATPREIEAPVNHTHFDAILINGKLACIGSSL